MILARVLGNVVATQKNSRYGDSRIMLVQEGWSASTASTGEAGAAIDSAIIGVVDSIEQDTWKIGSDG
jgi:microcompartment protein CcmK/EutM